MSKPGFFRLGTKQVTIIRAEGTDSEECVQIEARVQASQAFFAVDAPVYDGDVLEVPDPRGGTVRSVVQNVKVHDYGSASMQHIEATLVKSPPPRVAAVRRLTIEKLHASVVEAAGGMFADEHYSQAVFEACKALEVRVRDQSGLDLSGRDLMNKAFSGSPPPIDLSVEPGRSGRDEQEGLRFIFMGVMQGIRNPKGHGLVAQDDPQRALEYLGLASVLFRRLDDAAATDAI